MTGVQEVTVTDYSDESIDWIGRVNTDYRRISEAAATEGHKALLGQLLADIEARWAEMKNPLQYSTYDHMLAVRQAFADHNVRLDGGTGGAAIDGGIAP